MKILVVNCGSSSLKYELFDMGEEPEVVDSTPTFTVLARGLIERIGITEEGAVHHRTESGAEVEFSRSVADHEDAADLTVDLLTRGDSAVIESLEAIDAVGHRVVHGGDRFVEPAVIDDSAIATIEECAPLAPLHNPPNLAGIRAMRRVLPNRPQVAVFDTAFHQTMPRHAYLYAIPRELYLQDRVRRYGFHGTNHAYVSGRAAQMVAAMGRDCPRFRLITCHLGNGCSMAAVVDGQCAETTMGLTPLEGLVMGTRSGDVDPGLFSFLARQKGWTAEHTEEVLNKQSGLLGLSGLSNDMRDVLEAAEAGDGAAQDAVAVFCYRVRKYIGALAAAMGGLDALAFTAGIGENSPDIRSRILEGTQWMGIQLDEAANRSASGDRAISTPGSKVAVLVVSAQEEFMIARETMERCRLAAPTAVQ